MDAAQSLVACGRVDLCDTRFQGHTALQWAEEKGHAQIAALRDALHAAQGEALVALHALGNAAALGLYALCMFFPQELLALFR